MDNYLVDRETLGQFIDALITKKYPGQPAEIYSNLRENSIAALDNKVLDSIFDGMTDEQVTEINALFDKDEQDPEVFRRFFENAGIDVNAKINGAFEGFAKEFLGGAYAE